MESLLEDTCEWLCQLFSRVLNYKRTDVIRTKLVLTLCRYLVPAYSEIIMLPIVRSHRRSRWGAFFSGFSVVILLLK